MGKDNDSLSITILKILSKEKPPFTMDLDKIIYKILMSRKHVIVGNKKDVVKNCLNKLVKEGLVNEEDEKWIVTLDGRYSEHYSSN